MTANAFSRRVTVIGRPLWRVVDTSCKLKFLTEPINCGSRQEIRCEDNIKVGAFLFVEMQ